MHQKIVTVKNSTGLHARPASMFIAEAKKFESSVTIGVDGEEKSVNAKSNNAIKQLTIIGIIVSSNDL